MPTSPSKPKLVIIDAMSMAHRAFHAFSRGGEQLRTPSGEPTSAVYGFCKAVLQILKDLKPDYMVVATDTKEPTFRHEEFAEYKGTRSAPHDDLIAQFPRIEEAIASFSLPYYVMPGFEADDIIGSLVKKLEKDYYIYISSGDLDLLQLLSEDTRIYAPKRLEKQPVIYDLDWLRLEKGLTPDQIVEYKGLVGDTSDNIPGVPGIGPKTANDLLAKYHDIDGIYKHLDELKPTLAEKLSTFKEQADQSRRLATIKTDIPLDFDPDQAGVYHFDREKVRKFFEEMYFKSLMTQIPSGQNELF